MAEINDQFDTILILDFGGRPIYSHFITGRCCEQNVYVELTPCTRQLKDVKFKPKGRSSLYDKDSPHADPGIYYLGVPILGYATGTVDKCDHQYAFAQVKMAKVGGENASVDARLVEETQASSQRKMPRDLIPIVKCTKVRMSYGGQLPTPPPNFHLIKYTAPYHSPPDKKVIGRFILNICPGGIGQWGVDSTVAAKLMHEAIGNVSAQFHVIMGGNGVLRLKEAKQDPEQKRKIMGNTFINVFGAEAAKIEAAAAEEEKNGAPVKGRVGWLLQGMLYPDVIESISFKGPSATIKTDHNVGGLPKDMKLKLVQPLRELFKSNILQQADGIYIEVIRKAGLEEQVAQVFAVLLPVIVVGVIGDVRIYILRRISSRITNEVTAGINHITCDISSQTPFFFTA
ncbi:hypothetical protein DFH08DRAFT_917667 [Mycena albidolilacea]|uniref:GMPS ATP-PPase domain-containing protein n=1 Tax=Mycena albidolilacea TaxID=1033008 RepID=A0AAD6ZCH2_9AGAR|nr:hypothetical protein DFH08DRAFT_917667 [Mycena albidolilacea]